MAADTSIGPEAPRPTGKDVKTQATVEGVHAQDANAFDMRHGLAGAETRPASQKPAGGSLPDKEQGGQRHPNNPGRYEGGSTIRELDMPDEKPRVGKTGLGANGS